MCLGIPGRIVEMHDDRGLTDGHGRFRRRAPGGLPCVRRRRRWRLGDYVVVHVGFAISQGGRGGGAAHLRGAAGDEPARRAGLDARGRRRPACRDAERPHEIPERVPRPRRRAGAGASRIRATATRRWTLMEVCGGQTHTIVSQGSTNCCGDAVEMIHGPGCPVCVTPLEQIDKALALAARPDVIFTSFGDMLRVPGSDCDLLQVRARGGDGARRVLAARRARAGAARTRTRRSSSSRSASRPPRPPTRWPCGGRGELGVQNFSVLVSHVTVPPAMTRHPRLAGQPGAGLPGRRPRLHGHGLDGVRADRGAVPGADHGHGVRAARHPRGDLTGGAAARSGPARGGEPVRAGGARATATVPAQRRWWSGCSGWPTGKWRGIGEIPGSGLALREEFAALRRRAVRARRHVTWRSRRSAAPATCCGASSSRTSAPPSGRAARPSSRWARRWCRRKARARPTTTSAGSGQRTRVLTA